MAICERGREGYYDGAIKGIYKLRKVKGNNGSKGKGSACEKGRERMVGMI